MYLYLHAMRLVYDTPLLRSKGFELKSDLALRALDCCCIGCCDRGIGCLIDDPLDRVPNLG